MADDLALLLRLRGENSQLKSTVADSRAAISSLRASSISDFKQIQSASTSSFGNINQTLTQITSNIPVVGRAFNTLANQLNTVSTASGSASTGIASVVTPAGAAVVVVAALTAGVVLLGKGLFTLAQQSSQFEGKFFDLSQQVGVAVETLSTLDIVAATSGGTIETVAASLGIFQKHLESAHDPTSKESKLLKELGVTSLDTEVALRQTLKGLFDLGTGAKQTDAVLQLFGRGGRFVNAILKETGGDLDAATKKFQDMGLIVGGPASAAADQFNDLMEIISRQLSVVSRQLVSETIPVFIVFFQDISVALTGNQNSWKTWSEVIKIAAAEAIAAVESLVQYVASRGTLDFGSLFEANVRGILDRASKLQSELFIKSEIEKLTRLGALAGSPGDRPDAGKAAAAAQARAAKEIALVHRELEQSTQFNRQALERERELDLKSIDEWLTKTLADATKHLKEQQAIFEQERANAKQFIKDRRDRELALREIGLSEAKAVDQFLLSTIKAQDEAKKRKDKADLDANKQIASIRDAAREGELTRIKDALDRRQIIESEAISRTLALLKDEQAQRLLLIDIELKQETTAASRKAELDNQKLESEQRYTDAFTRLTEQRLEALAREQLEQNQRGQIQGTPLGDDAIGQLAGALANAQLGPPPEVIQSWIDLKGTALDAMFSMAQAVGQLTQQWVLYGNAGPNAIKKMVAAVLAGVAAEAAVRAVMELAYGIAALTPWGAAIYGPAPLHFKSAALFAAVAAAAGLAGRTVAGGSFSSAGGGGDSGTGSGRPEALQTIDMGRNQRQVPAIPTVHIDIRHDEGVIVRKWVDDFNNGGITRETVTNDGT